MQEESFLIISSKNDEGKLKGFLRKMGSKYEQDSVLYKPADGIPVLLGTRSGSWPGKDVEIPLSSWHANKIGDFYSTMRGHRTFTFESVVEPCNAMTLGYMKKFSIKR